MNWNGDVYSRMAGYPPFNGPSPHNGHQDSGGSDGLNGQAVAGFLEVRLGSFGHHSPVHDIGVGRTLGRTKSPNVREISHGLCTRPYPQCLGATYPPGIPPPAKLDFWRVPPFFSAPSGG